MHSSIQTLSHGNGMFHKTLKFSEIHTENTSGILKGITLKDSSNKDNHNYCGQGEARHGSLRGAAVKDRGEGLQIENLQQGRYTRV